MIARRREGETVFDRRAWLLSGLDLAVDRGFEVGPLDSPIVVRPGPDIVYLDHANTSALVRKYDGDPMVGEIVEVDAVWGSADLHDVLRERIAEGGPFRYAVASHVIEHVPDLVGWLRQLETVIEPGGTLRLAIPDKRYCFDVHRTSTDVGALVAAHIEGRSRPAAAEIFDFWSRYTRVDQRALWAGKEPPPVGPGLDAYAWSKAKESESGDGYPDVHCWVFTPASFLSVLDRLASLDLLGWSLRDFRVTADGEAEFLVILERLPDGLDAGDRLDRQRSGVERFRRDAEGTATVPAWLSPREWALVRMKRRIVTRADDVLVRLGHPRRARR